MPSALTLALALLAPFILFAPTVAAAPIEPVGSPAPDTKRPWTPREMVRTVPATGPVTGHETDEVRPKPGTARTANAGPTELRVERRPPHRSHGRVFFRQPGTDRRFSCSGTVVRSLERNLVLTAGHCVYDHGAAGFNLDVTFVPAYRAGEAPFGQFRARDLYAPRGWVDGGNTAYDIGIIALDEPVQDTVGGRGISFRRQIHTLGRLAIYGYPALPTPRYDGERPIICLGAQAQISYTNRPPSLIATPCDMEQGSSGGAWIDRRGFIVSIVSHGFCSADPNSCGSILGPVLGAAAVRLYRHAGRSEPLRVRFAPIPDPITGPRRMAVVRFAARGTTPVSFECKVDRLPLRRCGTRLVLDRLNPGIHVVRVRATDQLGRRAVARQVLRVTG